MADAGSMLLQHHAYDNWAVHADGLRTASELDDS